MQSRDISSMLELESPNKPHVSLEENSPIIDPDVLDLVDRYLKANAGREVGMTEMLGGFSLLGPLQTDKGVDKGLYSINEAPEMGEYVVNVLIPFLVDNGKIKPIDQDEGALVADKYFITELPLKDDSE